MPTVCESAKEHTRSDICTIGLLLHIPDVECCVVVVCMFAAVISTVSRNEPNFVAIVYHRQTTRSLRINRDIREISLFTARCTLVQSAVLRSHVVCLSVTLVDCDHIGWNTCEIISPSVSLGCSLAADPNVMGLLQEEHPQIWAQNDPPSVDLSVGDIR